MFHLCFTYTSTMATAMDIDSPAPKAVAGDKKPRFEVKKVSCSGFG